MTAANGLINVFDQIDTRRIRVRKGLVFRTRNHTGTIQGHFASQAYLSTSRMVDWESGVTHMNAMLVFSAVTLQDPFLF